MRSSETFTPEEALELARFVWPGYGFGPKGSRDEWDRCYALGPVQLAAVITRALSCAGDASRSAGQRANSMGKLISALEFVIRHSDSLTPSDIQRMQAILAEVTGGEVQRG